MRKAMHRKKPSTEINVQALVVSFEEAGNPFEDDEGCHFALDSKVIVDVAAITAFSSVITSGIQQYNNFVEERLQKRTKPIKNHLRKNKMHVFVQQRKAQKSSLTILRNGCSLFSRPLHCMPDKERGPARIFQALKPANTTVIEQSG